MAHMEPMEVDAIGNEFDDKENSLQNSNVLPKTPSTEKGYEELDVSELNMKLRYSMTPASSPMSRSFTANSRDNKVSDSDNSIINMFNDNANLTHSFNSTITKTNNSFKSPKLPLQALSTEQFVDGNGNPINRSLDAECNNITITVGAADSVDDNLSLPSNSSSLVHTPEATTPTKEIPKDGGSPIMRGLKSVLNLFRPSQSPIPPEDTATNNLSPLQVREDPSLPTTNLASTPTAVSKNKENTSKANTPLKDSVVFNDDLEKELLWKDETTILFKDEKIPIHKLFFQSSSAAPEKMYSKPIEKGNMNTTVEYMDVSYNDSVVADTTLTVSESKQTLDRPERRNSPESDCEFVDCETFNKNETKTIEANIPIVPEIIKNISEALTVANENAFQTSNTVADNNALPTAVLVSDSIPDFNETRDIISNIDDVINGADSDLNYEQGFQNDLSMTTKSLDHTITVSNNLKEEVEDKVSEELVDNSSIANKNVDNLERCENETFDLGTNSEVSPRDSICKDYTIDKSNISNNNALLYEDEINDFKTCNASQDTKIEIHDDGELTKDLNSTTVLSRESMDNDTGTLNMNNITLPVNSQDVSEDKMALDVSQEQIQYNTCNIEVNTDIFNKCKEVIKIDKECEENIAKLDHNHEEGSLAYKENVIELENEKVRQDLPTDVPLPCDSDIEGDNLDDISRVKFLGTNEDDKSLNLPTCQLNLDESHSQEVKVDTDIPVENISQSTEEELATQNATISNTTHSEVSRDLTNINNFIKLEKDNDVLNVLVPINDNNNEVTNETDVNIGGDVTITLNDDSSNTSKAIGATTCHTDDIENELDANLLAEVQHFVSDTEAAKSVNLAESIPKDTDNKTEIRTEIINVDEVSIPSTNNMSITEIELCVSKDISREIENHFDTKNKLATSFEANALESDIESVSKQNPPKSITKDTDHKTEVTNGIEEVSIPSNNNNETVTEMELELSKHDSREMEIPFDSKNKPITSFETKALESDIEAVLSQNPAERIPEHADNKTEVTTAVDEVSSSTNIDNLVTEMELDLSKHDATENENPFDKNKMDTSIEVQALENDIEAVMCQNNKEITNKLKFGVNDEISIPSSNNISPITVMDVDSLKLVSENIENPFEFKNKIKSSLEVDSNIEYVNGRNYSESPPTVIDSVNEFTSEIGINDKDNIPTTNNSDVTEMDLDVSERVLDDVSPLDEEHQAVGLEGQFPVTDIKDAISETAVDCTHINIESTSVSDAAIHSTNDNALVAATDLLTSGNDAENVEDPLGTTITIRSSPPITSKFSNRGYNIDFDEIHDPFATKTNMRMSPTPNVTDEGHCKPINTFKKPEVQRRPPPNRRKSYQERKKPNNVRKGANVSFDCAFNGDATINNFEENLTVQENLIDKKMDNINKENCTNVAPTENIEDVDAEIEAINNTPPSETFRPKNVFNLPEIDDINFNPFATKTKIRQSPEKELEHVLFDTSKVNGDESTSQEICSDEHQQSTVNNDEIFEIEDNKAQDVSVKNLSQNLSSVNFSSQNTNDVTVREVHTEDEDTEEGPFFEAEDLADFVKAADIETEKDMMNFDDLPTQIDNGNVENGEIFIDAEAFEFLLNQNKSNVVADSGKESLFLKFDPLFAKRVSSDGVLAVLSKIQKRQSTPKKPTPLKRMMHENSPTPGPSNTTPIDTASVTTDFVDEPVTATSKPMMVVNPAVASIVSPRKSTTPPRVNRRSLNFTSPAMAVIDRLLSLSGNNSRLEDDNSLPPSREYNETDFALTQLRELLAEKEIHVHNLRSETKELRDRLATMESQVRSLETESVERLRKVNELNERLAEKNKINKSMAVVVEEYERTIASLIAEMEQEKKRNAEERKRIISDRDEQTAHLASMEVSFTDLHSKYEKSKQIILNMKSNEDTYRESLKKFDDNLSKMQNNYELLKQHATSKLNHANQELEKYNRAHEADVLKLNAMIKRKELHITSLEESLTQKTKANEELTAICDELINKVG